MPDILAGFEVGTGRPVSFTLHHAGFFGMTALAGKTTFLEGCITRSGLRALAFLTKRGEAGFHTQHVVPPYYKARADWLWLEGLVNAALSEKVKYEPGMRGAIMRVTEGTKGDLAEILAKSQKMEKNAKRAFERDLYYKLSMYLRGIVENMSRFTFSGTLELHPGVNVMNLIDMEQYPEIQQIVIAASMSLVHETMDNVIVVIPEAWQVLPQGRMTPVNWIAERFVRKGAAIGNYLFLDSQDLGGVSKTPLRQLDVWFFGRMKEAHEVERIGKQLLDVRLPPADIQTLKLGHFVAVIGNKVRRIYALPAGVPEEIGKYVAIGRMRPEDVKTKYLSKPVQPAVLGQVPAKELSVMERLRQLEQKDALRDRKDKVLAETLGHPDDSKNRVYDDLRKLYPSKPEETAIAPPPQVDTVVEEGVVVDAEPVNEEPKTVHIEKVDVEYVIHHRSEERKFDTGKGLGQILYAMVNDLQGRASTTDEIRAAMREWSWNMPQTTFAPNMGKLVKEGLVVKEGNRFRPAGKVKITVAMETPP